MKKRMIKLALGSAILLSISAYAEVPVSVSATAQDHAQFVTKRQVVDQLLQDALTAFKSPTRISHAGFTAKMPSNMEIVTERLLEAYQLEPYRTDLLISAANAQIYNQNIERAIELFEQALAVAPEDLDLLSYLSVWHRFQGNEESANKYMQALKQRDETQAEKIAQIFATVDRILETPLKDKAEAEKRENHAIVVLGYALNPDGSMHDILIKRLEIALEVAKAQPESLIVVTGGVPKNHKTEGKLMADWLIEKGIDQKRIVDENYATSTVDNALFSSYILARHNIKHATIISSASHVRRGQALFEIASWKTGPSGLTFDTVAYPDKPLDALKEASKDEVLGIYRDALRTFGMWSYRSYPLESR